MKILIVRLGSLGDIIHTVPAQQWLRSRYPRAELHWLCEQPYRELLEAVPGIRKVWVADTRGWRRNPLQSRPWALFRQLRVSGFDMAVDFQGLLKSAVLARASGAIEVVGFPARQLREPAAAFLYTRTQAVTDRRRHQVDHHLDLVDPPAHRLPAPAHPIPLKIPALAVEQVESALSRWDEPPVVLNLGGGWATKRWPPERFGLLADSIEREFHLPVLLTYGPGEDDLIQAAGQSRSSPVPALQTGLFELAALCRRSRLVVAGDTGPLHLAEALGTPVVAILGPALPWRTGPYSPDNPAVLHREACPHPYRRRCRRHFCMDIEVEKVLSAVRLVLERTGRTCAQGV